MKRRLHGAVTQKKESWKRPKAYVFFDE